MSQPYWAFRILRCKDDQGGEYFEIYDVEHTPGGAPIAHSLQPIYPMGNSVAELRADVDKITEAFQRPVLSAADFLETQHDLPEVNDDEQQCGCGDPDCEWEKEPSKEGS